jgi:polysaccharide deacetylase family protein (PEP-CTERM system associated)
MINIATVQLQDYYQHKVFETVITKRHWSRFESRLRRSVDKTLDLFDQHETTATFFTLGWLAERFPEMLHEIEQAGHEIGCAGFWGADRNAVTQSEFREDMRLGKRALEEVTGHRVDGYRSIRRSFSDRELWLLDLVAEEGFRYDSSVMPKGIRGTHEVDPRFPFSHETRRGAIQELPHSAVTVAGLRVPVGGGNFIRQLPVSFTRRAFQNWIRHAEHPFVLYFHPWELDTDVPEVSAFGALTRVRQYRNLGRLSELLPRYLEEAPFASARAYLGLPVQDAGHDCPAHESPVIRSVVGPAEDTTPISIVIPCHNEEAAIGFLSNALDEVTQASRPGFAPHYILVDDKSTDDTVRMLHEWFSDPSRFTIVELEENRGVSGAIQAGIAQATTEIVCSMDADCSYDPLELLKMIPLLDDSTALVTASPYHPDGAVLGVPEWRLFLSRGLSGIYRLFLRHKLATYTSCFRVYRKSVVQKYLPEYGDFRGIVELLARMDIGGEGIKEYPTTLQSRIFGFSKMKTLKTIRDHLRLLVRIRRYRKQQAGNVNAASQVQEPHS